MKEIVKVCTVNGVTFSVVTFTQIEQMLKIGLLLLTIGYTLWKWNREWRNPKV